jgi:hemerythrin superfamily protein
MNATELLKSQHREVESLFKRIEKAQEDSEKRELFEELAANLVAHDAIEREIFYPACEEEMGMNELLGEVLAEHGLVKPSHNGHSTRKVSRKKPARRGASSRAS